MKKLVYTVIGLMAVGTFHAIGQEKAKDIEVKTDEKQNKTVMTATPAQPIRIKKFEKAQLLRSKEVTPLDKTAPRKREEETIKEEAN
jgi:hypothetical protein